MMVEIVNLWRYVLLNSIHTPLVYGLGVGFADRGPTAGAGVGVPDCCFVSVAAAGAPPALDCCGPIDFKYAISCSNCSSFTSPLNVGIIDGCGKPVTIFALGSKIDSRI